MNLSEFGMNVIRHFEGFHIESYLCASGKWTNGIGSTLNANLEPFQEGERITENEVYKLFYRDIRHFEKGVLEAVEVDINQSQFDALVCLSHNIGLQALRESTLLKYLNNKLYLDAGMEFVRWNKDGTGERNLGLLRRRTRELNLYLKS